MKVEYEISESKLKDAMFLQVKQLVATAVKSACNNYEIERDIRDLVRRKWSECVDQEIRMQLTDCAAMKAMIDAAVQAQVKSHLAKLLKTAS